MVPAQQDSLRRQSRSCGDRPDPLRELLRSLPGIPAKLVYLARCRFNVQDRAVLDRLLDRRRDHLRVDGTDSVHPTLFRLSIAAQNILGPSTRIEEMRVLVLLFRIRESDLPRLETNLQSKLNLPWSSRRGESALLRRSQNRRVVAVLRPAVREQKIGMVQDIEKFRPELQVRAFGHMEILEYRHIPGSVAGCLDRISSDITERA